MSPALNREMVEVLDLRNGNDGSFNGKLREELLGRKIFYSRPWPRLAC